MKDEKTDEGILDLGSMVGKKQFKDAMSDF